jgi:hypothetical protein
MRRRLTLHNLWKLGFGRMTATKYPRVTSLVLGTCLLTLPRQSRNRWTKDPRFRDRILQSCLKRVGNWWKELSVKYSQWKNSVEEPRSGRARSDRTVKKLRIHGEHPRRWGPTLQMNLLNKLLGIRADTINARISYHDGAHPEIWRRVEHIWKLTRKSQSSCSDSTFTDCCRLRMNQKHARWRNHTFWYCSAKAQARCHLHYREKWNWTNVDLSGGSERSQLDKDHGKIGRVARHPVALSTVFSRHLIFWLLLFWSG